MQRGDQARGVAGVAKDSKDSKDSKDAQDGTAASFLAATRQGSAVERSGAAVPAVGGSHAKRDAANAR